VAYADRVSVPTGGSYLLVNQEVCFGEIGSAIKGVIDVLQAHFHSEFMTAPRQATDVGDVAEPRSPESQDFAISSYPIQILNLNTINGDDVSATHKVELGL